VAATVEVTFRPNGPGIAALASGPKMRDVVEDTAHRLRELAVPMSPTSTAEQRAYFARRYGRDATPVRYKESFRVYSFVTVVNRMPRWVATVVNEAPHAAAVEFGNDRTRGQHVLGRALAALAAGS